MNNKLGNIWKETVVAYFEALAYNLPWSTEENHKKTYAETVGIPAEIRTVHRALPRETTSSVSFWSSSESLSSSRNSPLVMERERPL
jgi:hypothetical protein